MWKTGREEGEDSQWFRLRGLSRLWLYHVDQGRAEAYKHGF